MRSLLLPFAVLLLLGPGSAKESLPLLRLDGPPDEETVRETDFIQDTASVWTAPYTVFVPHPGSQPEVLHPSKSGVRMGVDSTGGVHVVQIVQEPQPSGPARIKVVYQNNRKQPLQVNGFCEPIVLTDKLLDGDTENPNSVTTIADLEMGLDQNDQIQIAWRQSVAVGPVGLKSWFNRIMAVTGSASGGLSGPTQWTPEAVYFPPAPLGEFSPSFSYYDYYYPPRFVHSPGGALGVALILTGTYTFKDQNGIGGWDQFGYIQFGPISSPEPSFSLQSVTHGGVFSGPYIFGCAIKPDGTTPTLIWSDGAHIYYGGMNDKTIMDSNPLDFTLSHFFYDSAGDSHLYGNVISGQQYVGARYRKGPTGETKTLNSVDIIDQVFLDEKDSHYIFPGDHFLDMVSTPILKRLKNPQSGTLQDDFSDVGRIGFRTSMRSITLEFDHYGRGIFRAKITPDHRIYFAWNDSVCQTETYSTGARDSAAIRSIFPGGGVDLGSGNVFVDLPLFSTKGVGPTQALSLIYNSLDMDKGSLGIGWKLSADVYLIDHRQIVYNPMSPNDRPIVNGDTNDEVITLVRADGRHIIFRYQTGLGFFVADEREGFEKLERVSLDSFNTDYKMTGKTGDVFWFNSRGRLYRVVDPANRYMTLTYDGSNQLSSISDMDGRRSTIVSMSGGRVTQITDPNNKTYTPEYSGGQLTGISFNGGQGSPTHGFQYHPSDDPTTGARKNLLSQYVPPRGKSEGYGWTCRYHSNGSFASVTDPAEAFLLDSEDNDLNPSSRSATVSLRYDGRDTWETDRRGRQKKYVMGDSFLAEIHDEAVLKKVPGIFPVIRQFDFYGQLTSVQDRWGLVTNYDFADNGTFYIKNLMGVRRPKATGAGQDLVVSYTYTGDGFNQIETETTYATPTKGEAVVGRTTTYKYDPMRNLTSILHPGVTLPDGTTQSGVSRKFKYQGDRGAVSEVTDEEEHTTSYTSFHNPTSLPRTILRQGDTVGVSLDYDVMGNQTSRTDPKGGVRNDTPLTVTTKLDGMYRPDFSTDAAGMTTTYIFDLDSNLTTVRPPIGKEVTMVFDRRGIVSRGTGPDGSWSQAVDANGNVRKSTDLRGFNSTFTYDFMGRVSESIVPSAGTVQDPNERGGGESDTQTTQHEYDLQDQTGRYVRTYQFGSPNGREFRTDLDNRGRPTKRTLPDGKTVQETFYDELDQVTAVQVSVDNVLQTCSVQFRDEWNRIIHTRTQNTDFRSPTLDKHSDSYTTLNKVGSPTLLVDPLGSPAQQAGPAHRVSLHRDERNRVDQVIDGKGNVVQSITYGDDDLPIVVKVPDPVSKSSRMVVSQQNIYTARKEIKQVLNSRDQGTTYTYTDLPGQVDIVTDAVGRKVKNTYDADTQRPQTVTRGFSTSDASSVTYVWTKGLLTQTKHYNPESPGSDAIYIRDYDQRGRLQRMKFPTPATGTPMASRCQFYTDTDEPSKAAQGAMKSENQIDVMGRPYNTIYTGAYSLTVERKFNGLGQLDTIDDGGVAGGDGQAPKFGALKKSFGYDVWKGTPKVDNFYLNGGLFRFQVHTTDNAGNVIGLSDPEAKDHAWPVDENNRPTEKQYNASTVAKLTYTPGGLLDTETLHDATGKPITTTTYEYDDVGRVHRKTTVDVKSQEIKMQYEWAYTAANDIESISLQPLGISVTYVYNNRGELKQETLSGNNGGQAPPAFSNPSGDLALGNVSPDSDESEATPIAQMPVNDRTVVYEIDAAGNRTKMTVNGAVTTFSYNALSQLLTETWPDKTVDHEYDNRGNELKRTMTPSQGPAVVERFQYNYLNLLSYYEKTLGADSDPSARWQYDYWPTGERFAKTNLISHQQDLFITRGADVVTEYQQMEGGNPTGMSTYVQGVGIDSKTTRIGQAGERRHFIGDQVGTLGITLDDTGAIAEQTLKDAYGVQLAGYSAERFSGLAQRENDLETGLTYMRNRMYDPRTGRFTQTDPISGNRAFKHYSYCGNNPVNRLDPLGEDDFGIGRVQDAIRDVLRRISSPKTTAGFVYNMRGQSMTYTGMFEELRVNRWWDTNHPGRPILFDMKNGVLVPKDSAEVRVWKVDWTYGTQNPGYTNTDLTRGLKSQEAGVIKTESPVGSRGSLNGKIPLTQAKVDSYMQKYGTSLGSEMQLKVSGKPFLEGLGGTGLAFTGIDTLRLVINVHESQMFSPNPIVEEEYVFTDGFGDYRLLEVRPGLWDWLADVVTFGQSPYRRGIRYYREYMTGHRAPLDEGEYFERVERVKADYGYRNFFNEFVPGRLRDKLPDMYQVEREREQRRRQQS